MAKRKRSKLPQKREFKKESFEKSVKNQQKEKDQSPYKEALFKNLNLVPSFHSLKTLKGFCIKPPTKKRVQKKEFKKKSSKKRVQKKEFKKKSSKKRV
ncbi:hypothetical protein HpBT135_06350 [Helicobacter pylori]